MGLLPDLLPITKARKLEYEHIFLNNLNLHILSKIPCGPHILEKTVMTKFCLGMNLTHGKPSGGIRLFSLFLEHDVIQVIFGQSKLRWQCFNVTCSSSAGTASFTSRD
jgi:hypothetical protein